MGGLEGDTSRLDEATIDSMSFPIAGYLPGGDGRKPANLLDLEAFMCCDGCLFSLIVYPGVKNLLLLEL